MEFRMMRRDLAPSDRTVVARAVATEWDGDMGRLEAAQYHVSRFDLVLVRTREQYDSVLELGGEPVIINRRFSITDQRGRLRLRLGALLEPWRWRRTLLNEGVSSVVVGRGGRRATFVLAARLAAVRVLR